MAQRTMKEFNEGLELHHAGLTPLEISRKLNIPRRTIYGWINGEVSKPKCSRLDEFDIKTFLFSEEVKDAYIYMLGSYLGDGCITWPKSMRAGKIRIFCDAKQKFVIDENKKALRILFPKQAASETQKGSTCIEVGLYSTTLYKLFPQAIKNGKMKHERKLILEDWQKTLLVGREGLLLRGLFHSDGSFFIANQGNYSYYRYQFTNTSTDILNFIKEALMKLEISFTEQLKKKGRISIVGGRSIEAKTDAYNITIGKKEDVKKLYKFCGTKYNDKITELE